MLKLRIMLIDDNLLYRQALKTVLDLQHTSKIVSELSDGHNVLAHIEQANPQVICMDVEMPDERGADLTRRVLQRHPDVRVIALSAHANSHSVAEMFLAGARGFVVKGQPVSELLQAIHTVSEGQIYIDPCLDIEPSFICTPSLD